MNPDGIDWDRLDQLRRAFLEGTAGRRDYWDSDAALEAYDATFAQRIGWKWDFVLHELRRAGWTPPGGPLLDWGCGTGLATRAFLDHFGASAVSRVTFFDRSARATDFAARRARQRFPDLPVATGAEAAPALVLLSHVLTELQPRQVAELLSELRAATSILWVEPGTCEASLALIAIRERLRPELPPVAPCLHREPCGILAPGNEPHWCHFFATPPPSVFTDPFWARFGRRLGIDLRSVPLSYLVLDRRGPDRPPRAPEQVRVLGRPLPQKAEVRFLGCDASGVREHVFSRRAYPGIWRSARKDRFATLQPAAAEAPEAPDTGDAR